MRGVDLESFKQHARDGRAPEGVAPALRALWLDRQGDWDGAHELAQDEPGADGAWVHAYLHRKEGDHSNASYWYRRASRPASRASLEDEWEEIARALLGGGRAPPSRR